MYIYINIQRKLCKLMLFIFVDIRTVYRLSIEHYSFLRWRTNHWSIHSICYCNTCGGVIRRIGLFKLIPFLTKDMIADILFRHIFLRRVWFYLVSFSVWYCTVLRVSSIIIHRCRKQRDIGTLLITRNDLTDKPDFVRSRLARLMFSKGQNHRIVWLKNSFFSSISIF